jgi:hypothetical protein
VAGGVTIIVKLHALMAAPWLKLLVAGSLPRRPGFEPGSGQEGFCGGHSGAGAGLLRVI